MLKPRAGVFYSSNHRTTTGMYLLFPPDRLKRHKAKRCSRNLFLGLALFKLKNYDESESCYKEAIAGEVAAVDKQKKDKKENPAAWQGLANLYEAQLKVDEYMDTALKVAIIYQDLYAWVCISKIIGEMVAKVLLESEMIARDVKPS